MRKLLMVAAGAVALMAAGQASAVTLTYNNFNSTTGLQLNGHATQANDGTRNVLRVTPATFNRAGSAFSTDAIELSSTYSFSTRFTFNFNNQGGLEGADGLVFVIQPNSNTAGGIGGGIGYQGIGNSLGIEFDNYNNGTGDGNSANHAGVNFNGSVSSAYLNTSLPYTLDSGADLTAWVDYNGATQNLTVLLNNTSVRATATTLFDIDGLDLVDALNTSNTEFFVGFTSGTGGGFANHDVVNWEFRDAFAPVDVVPEPSTWAMMIMGFGAVGGLIRRRRVGAIPA